MTTKVNRVVEIVSEVYNYSDAFTGYLTCYVDWKFQTVLY